jgi:uncharacterized protein
MTFVPTLDTNSPHRPRIPRLLDPVEIRILGSLMEKQLSTPEYYPLTLNALVAACNQKSNRDPVMELSDSEVEQGLQRLQDEKLVWRVMGGRAVRFDHNLDSVWHLKREEKAVLTLLFLRGPQTAGELRGRSDRLGSFEASLLDEMAAHSEPLVRKLPRRPGQKEERWVHTVGEFLEETAPPVASSPGLSERVVRLEERVAELEASLRVLREKLGE